jgi:hypothetical protein
MVVLNDSQGTCQTHSYSLRTTMKILRHLCSLACLLALMTPATALADPTNQSEQSGPSQQSVQAEAEQGLPLPTNQAAAAPDSDQANTFAARIRQTLERVAERTQQSSPVSEQSEQAAAGEAESAGQIAPIDSNQADSPLTDQASAGESAQIDTLQAPDSPSTGQAQRGLGDAVQGLSSSQRQQGGAE